MSDVYVDSESLIRTMPEGLANKIAAGEVVQRPASALKELIENAVDAGADSITVILKEAGTELIQVVDSGSGMTREDARACFRRHATSKIAAIEDLERIRTLGFRGEALASIASVAQVELRTKRLTDSAGFCVRIDGGEILAAEPCATKDGTSIFVRNLFYNVPARRNFLKTAATELKHCVETFQFLALSHPSIAFALYHDDLEMYRVEAETEGDFMQRVRGRIRALYDEDYVDLLAAVEERTSYLTVQGYVGEPELHKRTRGEQFLFVNGRYVRNRSLDHAVFSAYHDVLPDGVYPFFALFLRLEPSRVDVNVHPTKAEIKFEDERGIYNFVRSIVRKGLASALQIPQMDASPGSWSPSAADRPFGSFASSAPPGSRAASDDRSLSTNDAGTLSDRLFGGMKRRGAVSDDRSIAVDDALLWQLHDRYILTQIRSGLMILDQNLAHERVLYERSLQNMESGLGLSQQLLFPESMEFGPADFELLKELMRDLRALGFDLELLSGRSVVVRGVPADIRSGDERTVLEDVLVQYKANRERLKVGSRQNLAKSIARRSAIRSGTRLSPKEMRSLIDQLFACEMPYACPHGRPTIVKIPIEELDARFNR